MNGDIVTNKALIIERCLRRIEEEYQGNPTNLLNYTKQDSIILNIQRACEAAIDGAMHIVAERRIGLPQSSREAFSLLADAGLLEVGLAKRLQAMVGFRNIAVHDYQAVNLEIVQAIIEKHLLDIQNFAAFLIVRR